MISLSSGDRSIRLAGVTTCSWRMSSRKPRPLAFAKTTEQVKAEGDGGFGWFLKCL